MSSLSRRIKLSGVSFFQNEVKILLLKLISAYDIMLYLTNFVGQADENRVIWTLNRTRYPIRVINVLIVLVPSTPLYIYKNVSRNYYDHIIEIRENRKSYLKTVIII